MMLDALRALHPAPTRVRCGPVTWYGGKGSMAAKIVPFIDVGLPRYVEPFCGGASIFFAKQPAAHEVLNDLDGEVVNLFRVLQSPVLARLLVERLAATPYSRAEFARALAVDGDAGAVDRAWAFFTRQNQGFGGRAGTVGNWGIGFRSYNRLPDQISKWRMRVLRLPLQAERLSRAFIDNRDAVACLRHWDTPETLHYVDPPYVHSTRKAKDEYAHEMTDADHVRLLDCLRELQGVVVLSGYSTPLYDEALAGWRRLDFKTACHAAGRTRGSKLRGKGAALRHVARVECVWLSSNHPLAKKLI